VNVDGAVSVDVVQVWLIPVPQPAAVLAELAGVLDAAERARAAEFLLPGPRARFVVAHGATRHILAARLGLPPGRLGWQRGRYGKPELAGDPPPVRMSLSHCGDHALLAVSPRRPVGVDLQRLPGHLDVTRMSARYYPPDEAAYVAAGADPAQRSGRYAELWARKEACVKAAGRRLTEGLRLPARGTGPVLLGDPAGPLPGPYLVDDLPAPAGFRAAVAVTGTAPYQVTQHHWAARDSTMDRFEQMVVEHA